MSNNKQQAQQEHADIPELDQAIDVNAQVPELTDSVQVPSAIPELTEQVEAVAKQEAQEPVQDEAIAETSAQEEPVHEDTMQEEPVQEQQTDDLEPGIEYLYQQVMELEREAALEHKMHNHPVSEQEPEHTEQQMLLEAAYQKLEALIMEQMPPQIAGSLITMLELNITANKDKLLEDFALLSEDELLDLLEQLDEDAGF